MQFTIVHASLRQSGYGSADPLTLDAANEFYHLAGAVENKFVRASCVDAVPWQGLVTQYDWAVQYVKDYDNLYQDYPRTNKHGRLIARSTSRYRECTQARSCGPTSSVLSHAHWPVSVHDPSMQNMHVPANPDRPAARRGRVHLPQFPLPLSFARRVRCSTTPRGSRSARADALHTIIPSEECRDKTVGAVTRTRA